MTSWRVGIVCPYAFDIPGGVQFHVRDLAVSLRERGHHVEILAPWMGDDPLPPFVTSAGRPVAVRYNGSVARLTFGPVTAAKVKKWLEGGRFDVVHLHEPVTPSASILTLWAFEGPLVATFHTSFTRSRAMQAAYPLVRSSLEKIRARVAVSEAARDTLVTHMGGDAVVVPNGVFVEDYSTAERRVEWQGSPGAPTVAFLGRFDEPRKGLPVLLDAIPAVTAQVPGVRFLLVGHGDQDSLRAEVATRGLRNVEIVGAVDDATKASVLRSCSAYVAPHLGGESFGIVLIEAMAAAAPVVAASLPAFRAVAAQGQGALMFTPGDAAACAVALQECLTDEHGTAERVAMASAFVRQFDWSVVTTRLEDVYAQAIESARPPGGTLSARLTYGGDHDELA